MASRITAEKGPADALQRTKRGSERVRVPKTAELVAARIRRQIIRGELSEGDALLSETELMGQFGISRPTLREAFRILESESLILVQRGSRGGARVLAPDIAAVSRYAGFFLQYNETTLEDVQAARAIIEPPAARMLAERRSTDACAALRAQIEREEAAIESGDAALFAERSTEFHEILMQMAGNQTLAFVVGMLHEIIERHAESSMHENMSIKGLNKSIRSQKKLVRLIEAGDADEAEKHWRNHVRNAAQAVLDIFHGKTVVDLFD
jgi:GntR family transcriptional regulator, transcriptional repressor for pyruvate dehydrogenase complex